MPVMIVTLKCTLLIPFGPWFPRSVVVLLAVTPVHTRDEGRDLVGDFFLASVGQERISCNPGYPMDEGSAGLAGRRCSARALQ